MTSRRRPEEQPSSADVTEKAIQAVLAIIRSKEPQAVSIAVNLLESGHPDIIEHAFWGMVERYRFPKYVEPRTIRTVNRSQTDLLTHNLFACSAWLNDRGTLGYIEETNLFLAEKWTQDFLRLEIGRTNRIIVVPGQYWTIDAVTELREHILPAIFPESERIVHPPGDYDVWVGQTSVGIHYVAYDPNAGLLFTDF